MKRPRASLESGVITATALMKSALGALQAFRTPFGLSLSKTKRRPIQGSETLRHGACAKLSPLLGANGGLGVRDGSFADFRSAMCRSVRGALE
jgi:hypothetical protein